MLFSNISNLVSIITVSITYYLIFIIMLLLLLQPLSLVKDCLSHLVATNVPSKPVMHTLFQPRATNRFSKIFGGQANHRGFYVCWMRDKSMKLTCTVNTKLTKQALEKWVYTTYITTSW